MRTDYITPEQLSNILRYMQADNALALETAACTGMRISDVLHLRTGQIHGNNISYTAMKTGKKATVKIPQELAAKLRHNAHKGIVFSGHGNNKHRTRQSVYADMRKACKALGYTGTIAPHSARKLYAVELYKRTDLDTVRQELQHTCVETTKLYAYSDRQNDNDMFNILLEILDRVRKIEKLLISN